MRALLLDWLVWFGGWYAAFYLALNGFGEHHVLVFTLQLAFFVIIIFLLSRTIGTVVTALRSRPK